jgi:hypothetical protein
MNTSQQLCGAAGKGDEVMSNTTFNIKVELGDTGLDAGDALTAIRDVLRPMIDKLYDADDQTAIPDGGDIFD